MISLHSPTFAQPRALLGELASNAVSRTESYLLESGTLNIAMAVARSTVNQQLIVKPSAPTDSIVGIVVAYHDRQANVLNNNEYVFQSGDTVTVIRMGDITVKPLVVVTAGDTAFVETAGANAGYFTNVASATTIQVGVFQESTTTVGDLARLYTNLMEI